MHTAVSPIINASSFDTNCVASCYTTQGNKKTYDNRIVIRVLELVRLKWRCVRYMACYLCYTLYFLDIVKEAFRKILIFNSLLKIRLHILSCLCCRSYLNITCNMCEMFWQFSFLGRFFALLISTFRFVALEIKRKRGARIWITLSIS